MECFHDSQGYGRDRRRRSIQLAEGVGFEPTVGCPTLDFESSALNRTQPPFLFCRIDILLIGYEKSAFIMRRGRAFANGLGIRSRETFLTNDWKRNKRRLEQNW